MFKSYVDRGDQFRVLVQALPQPTDEILRLLKHNKLRAATARRSWRGPPEWTLKKCRSPT